MLKVLESALIGQAGIAQRSFILLIEEDEAAEHQCLKTLRRQNIMNEVVLASRTEEALDYLFARGKWAARETSFLPAFVLIECASNLELVTDFLRQVRNTNHTCALPVVVLSSDYKPGEIEALYTSGANSVVKRPNAEDEYSETLLGLAMYWLLINESAAN